MLAQEGFIHGVVLGLKAAPPVVGPEANPVHTTRTRMPTHPVWEHEIIGFGNMK